MSWPWTMNGSHLQEELRERHSQHRDQQVQVRALQDRGSARWNYTGVHSPSCCQWTLSPYRPLRAFRARSISIWKFWALHQDMPVLCAEAGSISGCTLISDRLLRHYFTSGCVCAYQQDSWKEKKNALISRHASVRGKIRHCGRSAEEIFLDHVSVQALQVTYGAVTSTLVCYFSSVTIMHYHKFSGLKRLFIISQLCRSEVQAQCGSMSPSPRDSPDFSVNGNAFFSGSSGMNSIPSSLTLLSERSSSWLWDWGPCFCVGAGLCKPSHVLHVPPSSNSVATPFPTSKCNFICHIFPARERSPLWRIYLIMWFYWAHHDNLPILRSVTLITSAKSPLPCNMTPSRVPGIMVWTSLGPHSAHHTGPGGRVMECTLLLWHF